MADVEQSKRNSVALQKEMFRLADSEHGLSLGVLARTRKIPLSTLKGWNDGSAMPAWALGALGLPDDLVSLVLQPFRKFIGTEEAGDEGDIDALGLEALGLAGEIATARSEQSPGGPRIVPMERARIGARARKLCPKARAVAA